MEETQATGVLLLMFVLRCIAPLLLTLGIGYLMNRLVDRWEAQEAAANPQEAPDPAVNPDPPVIPDSGVKLPTITVPCWILRNCDQAAQADCPARKQPGVPCWLARLRAEGTLPHNCPDCPIYEDAVPAPVL